MKQMNSCRSQRERDFHDQWAEQTPLSRIRVFETFENITAQENRFILDLMGNLKGMDLLDIGAGLGESSVYFALKGANVTANDISPAMLSRCVELGRKHGVEILQLPGTTDHFDFGEDRFDVVYGANVLHHVGDIGLFLNGVQKALKPGGRFFFYDPLAYNPAINVYRRLATEVRTKDERPLRFANLRIFRDTFTEVEHREFWLATLLIFFKYFFIDRISPNEDRYWKRILAEDPARLGWWFNPLIKVDNFLLRLPLFRFLAWNIVIWGRR
jgi:2-polyprenyl-3-methyl-5-hydroxy-6-metoxy-1,4-benzoquinol methylase